jgi:activator of 2-hydroxyglutaryl-CoA dehydratase
VVEIIFVSNNETIWDPSRLAGKCEAVPKSFKQRYLSMLVAGIDVGAATAKTVILNEDGICASASVVRTAK